MESFSQTCNPPESLTESLQQTFNKLSGSNPKIKKNLVVFLKNSVYFLENHVFCFKQIVFYFKK